MLCRLKLDRIETVEHGGVAGERNGLGLVIPIKIGKLRAAALGELHLNGHDLIFDDLHRDLDRVGAERQLRRVDLRAVLVQQHDGDGFGDGLVHIAALDGDLDVVDGIDDRLRPLDGDGVKIKAGAVEHIALGDLDAGEIAPHLDGLADLPLDGEGDIGRGFVHLCDRRGGHGAGERDVVGHGVVLRAAHLGHVDHGLQLVLMLVERLEISVFAVKMHGDELLIVAGDDKPVILAQDLRAGERHGDIADGQIDVRVHDGHDVDPQAHGRKDGDDQGEELTFHLEPSFLPCYD